MDEKVVTIINMLNLNTCLHESEARVGVRSNAGAGKWISQIIVSAW